jgi:hypothetical protein
VDSLTAYQYTCGQPRATDTPLQRRCGFSFTTLSLSAIRPSSRSERAFILFITLLRGTLHCGLGDADIAGNLFAR